LPDSEVVVTAEVFAQKLKQKYPKRAAALGDRLIAEFVQDHPQYCVTYEGKKAVSVSWRRKSVSTAATATASTPAPDRTTVATHPEQKRERKVASAPTDSAQAQEPAAGQDDSADKPQAPAVNRRKQPRVPCRKIRAFVITRDVPGIVVDVVDISRGGLCFLSFEQFSPKTTISIATHYIEGGQNIFQDGRIVRVRQKRAGMLPTEYAVEFSN
jgi:hypothetical protein